MTLVVGRIEGRRIAVVSDTQISKLGMRLPVQEGVVKTYMLSGGICVSFSNSPELAIRAFESFVKENPQGAGFQKTIAFFEKSSFETENEYLIAFSQQPRIVKIAEGKRIASAAKTCWIGDKAAYERFREYEFKARKGYEAGRAVNAVLFADEMERSPASDLYSAMRHVIADTQITSVGGFAYVISNRDEGFRPSTYSDMLFDWPKEKSEDFVLRLTDQINLGASAENREFSISQASPGYLNLNVAAFYLLTARKIFVFAGQQASPLMRCAVIDGVAPQDIKACLDQHFGQDLGWLIQIFSASPDATSSRMRDKSLPGETKGLGVPLFCHANTYSRTPAK